jgi:outer membrane protein assembly factor BamB
MFASMEALDLFLFHKLFPFNGMTMYTRFLICFLALAAYYSPLLNAQTPVSDDGVQWAQWRGPNRDGVLPEGALPESINEDTLKKKWAMPLGPSYSGPLVVGDSVYVTETKEQKLEVVTAIDLQTGKTIWKAEWEGSMRVPFFAASNGSWIRATPAFDDGRLYVAGIRDVLVCLDASNGKIIWKLDFPRDTGSAAPNFGFVCSPLIDGDFLYVQAGGGFKKLEKSTGKVVWSSLQDGGGMNGSAFSSPVIAELGGKRQAVVQTRDALCGVDLETGKRLWSQAVKTFRGMNILTPTIWNGSVFTSTYGGNTQLINVASAGTTNNFVTSQMWSAPVEGYMSSPVIIGGHSFVHLRNQRFACFDLQTGEEKWRSKPFGKYASLVGAGDKILALDQKGELLLISASPNEFELIERRKVGDDSWAHLAVKGKMILIRNLDEVVAYEWE